MSWGKWLKQLFKKPCRHEFNPCDIKQLHHPAPVKPTVNEYREWSNYFNDLERYRNLDHVSCVCRKCGEEFQAHHGLKLMKFGTIVKEHRT